MVACFQLSGAARAVSAEKVSPPAVSAVRAPLLVTPEPSGLHEPAASEAAPVATSSATAVALADLSVVLLNVAIAVARAAVVVGVLIAPVVLRDPARFDARRRLARGACSRGLRWPAAGRRLSCRGVAMCGA